MSDRERGNKGGAREQGTKLALLVCLLLTCAALPSQAAQGNADALRKADAAFRAGYAASQQGHYEEARAQFAEVVRLAPQIPEGHEALASALTALGRPAEAL